VLLQVPGMGQIYTRAELNGNTRAGAPFFDAMRKSWHTDVSGDLQFVVKPDWMITGSAAATHGTPHKHDTHVPLMFYGPNWVKPAKLDPAVEIIDIAPTLARWLGLPAPAASEGKALPLMRP
jgi:arylsulfatase A-like enzyme